MFKGKVSYQTLYWKDSRLKIRLKRGWDGKYLQYLDYFLHKELHLSRHNDLVIYSSTFKGKLSYQTTYWKTSRQKPG